MRPSYNMNIEVKKMVREATAETARQYVNGNAFDWTWDEIVWQVRIKLSTFTSALTNRNIPLD